MGISSNMKAIVKLDWLVGCFVLQHINPFWVMAWWLECSPMAWETWVQSQVESYERLKKWYLMPPCLILSIIRYGSRVKWSNWGKGVAPSPTLWCGSYQKRSLRITLDYSRQLYLLDAEWNFKQFSLVSSQVKSSTVVEGDQMAPFSIATTLRCRGGCYSFPRIAPLYSWYVPYIAEC